MPVTAIRAERERMDAVRRYDILDTPPDGAFDRIAAVAAEIFSVPIAIVSVVDTDRIWFKAHHGLDVTQIDREPGLCASAITGSEPWIVTDAIADPRTLTNPLVAGDFGLRFYAGAPLTTHDGFNLGTLCVIDQEPREVTPQEAKLLVKLAQVVVDELELRRSARIAVDAAEQAQARIEEQASLLDLTQDAIFVKDLEHRILFWNDAAERIYGWSALEALGHTLDELIAPDRSEIDAALAVVRTQGEWSGELHVVDRAGAALVLESRWTFLRNRQGRPKGVLAVNTDVTERRATEVELIRRLEDRATRDPLTGLPNRSLLDARLDEAMAASQRTQSPLAVLFIDLDFFKGINDGFGHLLGDKVLMEVARRLESTLRDRDTVARFGGDEFVVLLPDIDGAAAGEVAHRLLAAVGEPMELDGHLLHVSVSIGVAASPPLEPQALLRSADAGAYYAKSHGRAQVRTYTGESRAQPEVA